MASISSLNNDALTEILLRLPIRSLSRFKTVCKLWRDVIVSPSFRKLRVKHQSNNGDDHDKVVVQIIYGPDCISISELSIMLPITGKSYSNFPALRKFFEDHKSPLSIDENRFMREFASYYLCVVGVAKGLICLHTLQADGGMFVCNPSLGKIRKLPESPTSFPSCNRLMVKRNVGIGFDNIAQDYKVVQLLSCCCRVHCRRMRVSVYSRATNSWREYSVSILDKLYRIEPIRSPCTDGSFFYWQAFSRGKGEKSESVIVSFDVNNEVFWTYISEIPEYEGLLGLFKIFAAEEYSFVLFLQEIESDFLKIYEAVFEGNNTLRWNLVTEVTGVGGGGDTCLTPEALWRSGCVILTQFIHKKRQFCFYDFLAKEIVGLPFEVAASNGGKKIRLLQYKGSFVSP